MSEYLNRCEIQGLVVNPEFKHTSSGNAILKMRVKIVKEFTKRDQTVGSRTTTIFVTAWSDLAQSFKDIQEGSWVNIKGEWTVNFVKETKKYYNEITAKKIELIGGEAPGKTTISASRIAVGNSPEEARGNLNKGTGQKKDPNLSPKEPIGAKEPEPEQEEDDSVPF